MESITRTRVETYEEKIPQSLKEFENWEFTSGTTTHEDFKVFARKFKQFVKKNIPLNAELVDFEKGHYILSGFIEKEGKFVYFSVSDVRFFKNEWKENILVRQAKGIKDFTGGSNCFTDLNNFKEKVSYLLK